MQQINFTDGHVLPFSYIKGLFYFNIVNINNVLIFFISCLWNNFVWGRV